MHTPGSESEAVMSHLSAHADYRHEDYYFARTQSRGLAAREWEHTERLRSWLEILYATLGAAAALLVVAEMVL
jgi:sarcosine oxidase delta subunit